VIVVADTSAMLALVDRSERHHAEIDALYAANRPGWLLPAPTLAELDYLIATRLGAEAQDAWIADVAAGAFAVEWCSAADAARAGELHRRYRALRIGWVDAMVMAVAERLQAGAIATLDRRHFAPVALRRRIPLLPGGAA
jgi:uncharacterized protein